jgi:hypothetical protein
VDGIFVRIALAFLGHGGITWQKSRPVSLCVQ